MKKFKKCFLAIHADRVLVDARVNLGDEYHR